VGSGCGEARVDGNEKRRRGRETAEARRLYQDLFSDQERAALAGAAESNDLDQEPEPLRVLIRRAVARGQDLETVSH